MGSSPFNAVEFVQQCPGMRGHRPCGPCKREPTMAGLKPNRRGGVFLDTLLTLPSGASVSRSRRSSSAASTVDLGRGEAEAPKRWQEHRVSGWRHALRCVLQNTMSVARSGYRAALNK